MRNELAIDTSRRLPYGPHLGLEVMVPGEFEEIAIAGNLKDMFSNLVVGNEVDPSGNIRAGSILIESMTLAGS